MQYAVSSFLRRKQTQWNIFTSNNKSIALHILYEGRLLSVCWALSTSYESITHFLNAKLDFQEPHLQCRVRLLPWGVPNVQGRLFWHFSPSLMLVAFGLCSVTICPYLQKDVRSHKLHLSSRIYLRFTPLSWFLQGIEHYFHHIFLDHIYSGDKIMLTHSLAFNFMETRHFRKKETNNIDMDLLVHYHI